MTCDHKYVWPNGNCVDCGVLITAMPGHAEPRHFMLPRSNASEALLEGRRALQQRLDALMKYGTFSHLNGCDVTKQQILGRAQGNCDCGFEAAFAKAAASAAATNLERYGHLADHGGR
jgi:hypothetical protein